MERGKKSTQTPGGGWDNRGEGDGKMEMMGVVFRTYELRGGSSGSCVAEECWLGWKALSTDLVAAKYTQAGPFPLVYYYQYIYYCVSTIKWGGLLTWCLGYQGIVNSYKNRYG